MKNLHLILLTLLITAFGQTGWGQVFSSADTSALLSRLDRLEQRLNALESQKNSHTAFQAPEGSALADIQNRMSDLEQENSQVNGGVERMGHAVERMAKRMDDLTKDFDLRLQDLEKQKMAPAAPAQPAATAEVATTPETPATSPTVNPKTGAVAAADGKSHAVPVPAGLKPQDHYNRAYAYLTGADYPNARLWLEEFLKRYPKDALGDQAYYWLGEVYLVQNNPQAAVVSFKNGIQTFPKGGKVPADLLKMGVALQQLGKPDFAKAAWEKLVHDYPKAPEADKARVKLAEMAKSVKK